MDTHERPDGLIIRRVALDALHQDSANARAHDERNLDAIKASLQRFGQAEPLVVRAQTRRVIGGNGRLEAMRALGWTECDVVELDVDETQATALGIALNRTAELAEWDMPTLGKLLESLREDDAADATGFDDAEIDELLAELAADLEEPRDLDDPGPEALPVEAVSRAGDLWVLGDHRLLCGDAMDLEAAKHLLGEECVDLVWTDPPYGVSYTGKTKDALEIENDALTPEQHEQLLRSAFGNALSVCREGGVWYVTAPSGPSLLPFAKCLTDLGIWRQTLVWVKDVFVMGRSDFHYRHEAVFYGWKPGAAHKSPSVRTLDTVLAFDRPKASRDHPTMKPVELVAHCIQISSKPGGLVLDPFAGSGTTLIAAESTGRASRALEVDPRYCDVAVLRWQKATGKAATLDGDGRTFEAIAAERKPS